MQQTDLLLNKKTNTKNIKLKNILKNYQLYLFLVPALIYIVIFKYAPMYGLQLAFKDYKFIEGIWGSPWVGWENFRLFFNSYSFWLVIKNTLALSLYGMIAGFPLPIILALLLHHLPSKKYRKMVQMVTYAPHFISTVVVVGIINVMLAPQTGLVNIILKAMGLNSVFFMAIPEWFRHIFVWSGIWQHIGWSSIIYIAALSAIDPTLYEAAIVDGASRLQRILYIDLPGIMPTAIILLILRAGRIMLVGFEKVYLMQNPINLKVSEILATYVYKTGIEQARFEMGTTVGLFNAMINFALLVLVNQLAKKYSESSLF